MECKRCLFTSEIAKINNRTGNCEYCDLHDKLESQSVGNQLGEMAYKIKKAGVGKQYDCLVGISGGLDSSLLLYLAVKQWGLKPLVIHFDNWWNVSEASNNMNSLLKKLNVNSIVYKVDKKEYDTLNESFLSAGVPDCDIPNDIAMTKLMYQTADQYGIKYILNGHDFRTEGSTPKDWTYMDAKYIRSVYERYTGEQLKNYPLFTFKDQLIYALKGIKQVRPFYFISDRTELELEMKRFVNWQSYGGKHCENIYTEFIGAYVLPKKFQINKTIVYLSARVRSGKISKSAATEILANIHEFKLEKLGEQKEPLLALLKSPIMPRSAYSKYDFKKYKFLIWILVKLKVVPYTFYKKYACA